MSGQVENGTIKATPQKIIAEHQLAPSRRIEARAEGVNARPCHTGESRYP
jgi:hypothetical protein